jgi:TIR domain
MVKKKKAKRTARRRIRRTNAQLFLDKLTQLSEGQQQLIGNKTLREALGWEDDRYSRIRSGLVDQRKVIVGRGYGGTVGLATAPGTKALSIFISYSHADEAFKTELVKHLEPLRRLQLVETWHDRKIKAGDEWDKVISANLEHADIVLLLVSIDFINSSYCYDVELERALDRHAAGDARVIPIILRSCMWHQAPFAKLQALPKDARAVSLWSDRDEALVNVVEGVRQVAEQLLSAT